MRSYAHMRVCIQTFNAIREREREKGRERERKTEQTDRQTHTYTHKSRESAETERGTQRKRPWGETHSNHAVGVWRQSVPTRIPNHPTFSGSVSRNRSSSALGAVNMWCDDARAPGFSSSSSNSGNSSTHKKLNVEGSRNSTPARSKGTHIMLL